MAIRFVSFEHYRDSLGGIFGASSYVTFTAGLASGLTEAVLVVTPAEVCKIRMQSQFNSLVDPTQKQHRKYTNVAQTAFVIVKEEGIGALYKGVNKDNAKRIASLGIQNLHFTSHKPSVEPKPGFGVSYETDETKIKSIVSLF